MINRMPAGPPVRFGRNDEIWSRIRRCLVLAPHPDDFDVVAVTLRRFERSGVELFLDVLTSGASGVEDCFAGTWEEKASAREAEQRESCKRFGLPGERIGFHRLKEDGEGCMVEDEANENIVRGILDRLGMDTVVLPHGSDSNADHRRTFRIFDQWARERKDPLLAMLVRDPKTLGMRLDMVTPFDDQDMEWKSGMLRCHASQHERNLRSRGIGIDERILQVNREIAEEADLIEGYAEGFEIITYGEIE